MPPLYLSHTIETDFYNKKIHMAEKKKDSLSGDHKINRNK